MTAMLDVLAVIVPSKLDAKTLLRLSSVSRDMHKMCTRDELWERLMREDFRWACDWHVLPDGPYLEGYRGLVLYSRRERRISQFSLRRLMRSLGMCW